MKTARQAARDRDPLDGADAQALEGALAMTERERDAVYAKLATAVLALQEMALHWNAWRDCEAMSKRARLALKDIGDAAGEP